jgi:hypothetical protein
MQPWEAEILQTLIAAAGGVSFFWIFTRFWLKKKELEHGPGTRFWLKKKELEHGPGGDRMQRALEDVREEMQEMRTAHATQLAEVHERMDFAERLLTEAHGKPQLEKRDDTPG